MVQAVENHVYAFPNTDGAKVNYKERYENYIGGKWTPPVNGEYFDNPTPVTGKVFTQVARSTKEDIELALDAAHAAKDAWGKTSVTERSNILNKIADRMEAKLRNVGSCGDLGKRKSGSRNIECGYSARY